MSGLLSNKRILFFGLETFGYEKKILKKMRDEGAYVDYYSERPVSSKLGKTIIKLCPSLMSKTTERYYKNIIEKHRKDNYDIILIIKCDMPTKRVLSSLKETFPKAELRLHLWDSLSNIKGIKSKLAYFDKITSFDRKDCAENPDFGFRPLFFADEFKQNQNENIEYDVSFCGTIHSDRYPILSHIAKILINNNLRYFSYYYLQSIMAYYYLKLTDKRYRAIKVSEFKFESIPTEKVNLINQKSKAIVDIQHPHQVGLTMRTIETIGSCRKLITTNADIVNYDFYNENNICVINRENPSIPFDFLNSEYQKIPTKILQKYSLKQWVNDVLTM